MQVPTSFAHRPLRSKILNEVIHSEMVTLTLGGFNPLNLLQIPTSFNHRLLRSNSTVVIQGEMLTMRLDPFQINLLQVGILRFPTSHRPLCSNPTVVIHLKMITIKLEGPLNPLQIPTSLTHRLHRRKAISLGSVTM